MRKVLITGGFGFVGSALLTLLHERTDIHITVLDNLMSRPDMTKFTALFRNISFICGDIRDIALTSRLVRTHDVIIHLAAIVGAPACDININLAHMINVTATDTIIDAMSGDQRVIFMSSTSAYGDKKNILVTEETELTPLSSYGLHKMIGESIVTHGQGKYIIFRPATAFGISQMVRIDLLPNTLAYNALTTGILDVFQPEVIRPFIHVSDFARAIAYAFDEQMPWNNVYNIGNPALTVKKGELAAEIAALAKATVLLREGSDPDKRNYAVSFTKLQSTGFVSHAGFKQGFNDVKKHLLSVQANYQNYTTPGNVLAFLEKDN